MRIVIDGRMYSESGIGRYIRNLVLNLQKLDKKNEYFILHIKNDYDRLVYNNNFKKVLLNIRWYTLTEQLKLPRFISELKPDLIHFPHFNVPIFFKGQFVITIHDLIHQHFQMRRATTLNPLSYKIKQLGYKTVFKNAIIKSSKILVPSNYVKSLLKKEWNVDENKIVVTHEAVDDKIFSIEKIMGSGKIESVMEKFNIKQPYIFYVGNAHPHKNVEGLIRVFRQLREKYSTLSLVLSGYNHYFWQRVKKEHQHPAILYTGFISDEELVALYKTAEVFVLPSLEEGFGIPILEAMACECPVVSSNAGALPEVGGDAALYFDPADVTDMEDKIERVLKDNSLRNDLIKKGKQRIKVFSWDQLARQTLEVYRQCV